ncbi:MAG: hypothetical protein ACFB0C_21300 [Leptolyngbyaceae cyanobacterium]
MRNPFWQLKTIPWLILLQCAGLTIAIATLLDILLLLLLVQLAQIWPASGGVIAGGAFTALLLTLLIAGGIGALAVILMEKVFRSVFLNRGTLWALVVCLALVLWIKGFFPIPTAFVSLSQLQFVGMMLGLFSKGRSYWR